jgi:hypothetical protein
MIEKFRLIWIKMVLGQHLKRDLYKSFSLFTEKINENEDVVELPKTRYEHRTSVSEQKAPKEHHVHPVSHGREYRIGHSFKTYLLNS